MIYAHLVAASDNNVIGKDNQLLWHLPKDLKYFKNKTWGMPVIMGRKTYESVDKPLLGRANIVITRQADWTREDVIIAKDIDEAISKAEETECKEIFIIGGGEIYKQSLDKINRIYLTRVHATLEGDTYYPDFNKDQWNLVSSFPYPADNKHAYAFTFETWDKS